MSTTTLSAHVDDDSKTKTEFEQFKKERGIRTNSEAVRQLVKVGLQTELSGSQPATQHRDSSDEQPRQQSNNVVSGNESILIAIAFLLGGQSFLQAMSVIVGSGLASAGFVAFGVLIIAGMLVQNHDRLLKPFGGSQ